LDSITGVKVYRRFYTEEQELENGVLAIVVSKFTPQPYDSLATLFCVGSISFDTLLTFLLLDLKIIYNSFKKAASTLLYT